MSPKSSVPQAASLVSQVLMSDMGQKTVTLAATLPMAIFDATITKISEGTIRRSVSACLFEAIDQAGQREPPVPHSNDDAEIPF